MLDEILTQRKKHGRHGFYIAEIGLNHNGKADVAEKMIISAAAAGADAVKFQTIDPRQLNSVYTKSLLEKGDCSEKDFSVIQFFDQFSLTENEYIHLKKTAEELGMVFFSSPFDSGSAAFLEKLNVPLYKIASSEVTNIRLIREIGLTGKPAFMSTGICRKQEISAAIDAFKKAGGGELILFHCVANYPVEDRNANLLRIPALRQEFGLETGLSDHSRNGQAVPAAAALGARFFERHFTIDKNFACPDKDVSSDPEEFRKIILAAENVFAMLGSGQIDYGENETPVAAAARRSLFAARNIEAGELITEDSIIALRPGTGISAGDFFNVAGRRAKVFIPEGALLKPEDF